MTTPMTASQIKPDSTAASEDEKLAGETRGARHTSKRKKKQRQQAASPGRFAAKPGIIGDVDQLVFTSGSAP